MIDLYSSTSHGPGIKKLLIEEIVIEMSPFCDKNALSFLPSTIKHLTKSKLVLTVMGKRLLFVAKCQTATNGELTSTHLSLNAYVSLALVS